MWWGTVKDDKGGSAALLIDGREVVTVRELNRLRHTSYPTTLEEIIVGGLDTEIGKRARSLAQAGQGRPLSEVTPGRPLTSPERIVGIGLNYSDHARDLGENVPPEPATFLKPLTTLIGDGEAIRLPRASGEVTGEAEVGLVFSRRARNVDASHWREVIFGALVTLDMTALDVLSRNPRFLTRAKGYDTFMALAPWIVTLDEVATWGDIRIETRVNGKTRAANTVAKMTYNFGQLVSLVTQDAEVGATAILSTGTPGAWPLHAGDVAEAWVEGLHGVACPVVQGGGIR